MSRQNKFAGSRKGARPPKTIAEEQPPEPAPSKRVQRQKTHDLSRQVDSLQLRPQAQPAPSIQHFQGRADVMEWMMIEPGHFTEMFRAHSTRWSLKPELNTIIHYQGTGPSRKVLLATLEAQYSLALAQHLVVCQRAMSYTDAEEWSWLLKTEILRPQSVNAHISRYGSFILDTIGVRMRPLCISSTIERLVEHAFYVMDATHNPFVENWPHQMAGVNTARSNGYHSRLTWLPTSDTDHYPIALTILRICNALHEQRGISVNAYDLVTASLNGQVPELWTRIRQFLPPRIVNNADVYDYLDDDLFVNKPHDVQTWRAFYRNNYWNIDNADPRCIGLRTFIGAPEFNVAANAQFNTAVATRKTRLRAVLESVNIQSHHISDIFNLIPGEVKSAYGSPVQLSTELNDEEDSSCRFVYGVTQADTAIRFAFDVHTIWDLSRLQPRVPVSIDTWTADAINEFVLRDFK